VKTKINIPCCIHNFNMYFMEIIISENKAAASLLKSFAAAYPSQ
jgi:hypothetical protein